MCDGGLAKKLLLLFNVIFWVGGLILLGFGIWMKVDPNIVHYLAVVNVSGNMPLLSLSAWLFIIVGGVVLFIGIIGCLGAMRHSQSLLFIYALLVLIVMIVEIVGGVLALVYRMKMEGNLNASMTAQIKYEYMPNNTATYDAWEYLQQKLECCGASNFTDYENSMWWNSTYRNSTTYVPSSCCVMENVAQCQMEAKTKPDEMQYLHHQGCSEAVKTWFESHTLTMMILGIVIGACQIFAFFSACILRNAMKTNPNKYSPT